jgi:hypothetical protein
VELNEQLNPRQKKIYDTISHYILSGYSFTDMAKHFFVTLSWAMLEANAI